MDVRIVRRWLAHVGEDLNAAWSAARGPRASLSRAAYLVQQAAEKLVKAALVAHEVRPPRTHDIEDLTHLMPEGTPYRERFRQLRRFTVFAFAFRYPEDDVSEPEPTPEQINHWIGEIEALEADFERWVEEHGGGSGEPGG